MGLYYKNKEQGDLSTFKSFNEPKDSDSVPDQIELKGEAANLNGKFQNILSKRVQGEISDKILVKEAQEILDVFKNGAGAKKNNPLKR
jgi:hypothetical protein